MNLSINSNNIIKTNNIEVVEQVIEKIKLENNIPLVLFNISDVCFKHLYSVQSGDFRKVVAERVKILPEEERKAAINKIRTLIVNGLEQSLIEEVTPTIISRIQEQIPVIGIFGRSAWASYAPNGNNADLVNKYLAPLNIDFADSKFVSEIDPQIYKEKDRPSFQHGILFTSGKPSAEQIQNPPSESVVVKKFLEDIHFEGKTLIVINNSERSLKKMVTGLTQEKFEVYAIQYPSDKIKNEKNPLISDLQFLQLVEGQKISSDEEAAQLLDRNGPGDLETRFNAYILSRKWEQIQP